jgi:hypothetical protein
VAACVAGVFAGVALTGSSGHGSPAASIDNSASGSGGASAPCAANQLTGRVLLRTSAAGKNLVVVGLTNTGASSCALSGYPQLTARGPLGGVIDGVTVSNGTSQLANPGPRSVTVAAGATASFGLESTTSYPTPTQSINTLDISLPNTSSSVLVSLDPALLANAPAGQAINLGLTAYQLATAVPTVSLDPSSAVSVAPSSTPTVSGPSAGDPCDLTQLAVVVGRVDSGAGQRNLPVTLTNTFGPACTVTGFPQNLTAYTTTTADPGSQVSIKAAPSTGSVQMILLAKGASASFVFHSTIGYDTTPVTIVLLRFTLAGSPGQVSMEIDNGGISANGPSGQPIPVDVTALQPGTS